MICFMVNIQNLHPEPSKQNLYIVTKTQQSANTNPKKPRRASDDRCTYSILVGTDAYLASATEQRQRQPQLQPQISVYGMLKRSIRYRSHPMMEGMEEKMMMMEVKVDLEPKSSSQMGLATQINRRRLSK